MAPLTSLARNLIQDVDDEHHAGQRNSWSLLKISPIQASRAQQRPCSIVVVPAVYLHVARKRGVERYVVRGYPIQDGAFHALRVIRSGAGDAFLNL